MGKHCSALLLVIPCTAVWTRSFFSIDTSCSMTGGFSKSLSQYFGKADALVGAVSSLPDDDSGKMDAFGGAAGILQGAEDSGGGLSLRWEPVRHAEQASASDPLMARIKMLEEEVKALRGRRTPEADTRLAPAVPGFVDDLNPMLSSSVGKGSLEAGATDMSSVRPAHARNRTQAFDDASPDSTEAPGVRPEVKATARASFPLAVVADVPSLPSPAQTYTDVSTRSQAAHEVVASAGVDPMVDVPAFLVATSSAPIVYSELSEVAHSGPGVSDSTEGQSDSTIDVLKAEAAGAAGAPAASAEVADTIAVSRSADEPIASLPVDPTCRSTSSPAKVAPTVVSAVSGPADESAGPAQAPGGLVHAARFAQEQPQDCLSALLSTAPAAAADVGVGVLNPAEHASIQTDSVCPAVPYEAPTPLSIAATPAASSARPLTSCSVAVGPDEPTAWASAEDVAANQLELVGVATEAALPTLAKVAADSRDAATSPFIVPEVREVAVGTDEWPPSADRSPFRDWGSPDRFSSPSVDHRARVPPLRPFPSPTPGYMPDDATWQPALGSRAPAHASRALTGGHGVGAWSRLDRTPAEAFMYAAGPCPALGAVGQHFPSAMPTSRPVALSCLPPPDIAAWPPAPPPPVPSLGAAMCLAPPRAAPGSLTQDPASLLQRAYDIYRQQQLDLAWAHPGASTRAGDLWPPT
mmetsp:Transcript_144280/g.461137  ORF Transcript_144280/g.461137 Transcript_144280/m.461137 type:complete len:695 (+) Transcript_144280:1523-3607(+)